MPKPANEDVILRALEIYKVEGPTAAAKECGVAKSTVCKWAKARGITTAAPQLMEEATRASVARRNRSMAEWREEMTNLLREISEQAANVEHRLLSARGKNTPALEKATAARVKSISDLMLLTGEATSRIGLQGDMSDHASQVAKLRDELAERRKKVAGE